MKKACLVRIERDNAARTVEIHPARIRGRLYEERHSTIEAPIRIELGQHRSPTDEAVRAAAKASGAGTIALVPDLHLLEGHFGSAAVGHVLTAPKSEAIALPQGGVLAPLDRYAGPAAIMVGKDGTPALLVAWWSTSQAGTVLKEDAGENDPDSEIRVRILQKIVRRCWQSVDPVGRFFFKRPPPTFDDMATLAVLPKMKPAAAYLAIPDPAEAAKAIEEDFEAKVNPHLEEKLVTGGEDPKLGLVGARFHRGSMEQLARQIGDFVVVHGPGAGGWPFQPMLQLPLPMAKPGLDAGWLQSLSMGRPQGEIALLEEIAATNKCEAADWMPASQAPEALATSWEWHHHYIQVAIQAKPTAHDRLESLGRLKHDFPLFFPD